MFKFKGSRKVKVDKNYFNAVIENNKLLDLTSKVLMSNLQNYNMTQSGINSNPYRTWELQVAEVKKKYAAIADWGNQLGQRIINLRVAFSVPGGISITRNPDVQYSEEEFKASEEFLKDFLSKNGLDRTTPRKMAVEAELQGNVLISVGWDSKEMTVKIKYYPKDVVGYKIERESKYEIVSKLTAKFTVDSVETKLVDDQFVLIMFNDIDGAFNGYPTLGGVLRDVENIEKDKMDWRKLNHLFAHPTPHFKCETKDEADAVSAMITATGWKVGSAIATNSELKLVGVAGTEVTLLQSAIVTGAKVVSGHTGIGIHFLGFANVMSNRATADSMGEPQEVALQTEIAMWQEFYTSLIKKAIRLRNSKIQKAIKEDAFVATILPITDRQWKILKDIYMPATQNGLLSRETFLENVPGLDVEQENKRLDEEDKKKEAKKEKIVNNNSQQQDEEDDDEQDDGDNGDE